jgi:hypothetical protein
LAALKLAPKPGALDEACRRAKPVIGNEKRVFHQLIAANPPAAINHRRF